MPGPTEGRAQRQAEVEGVNAIVGDEVERFAVAAAALQAAPLVGALRERAEDLRLAELRRHQRQLSELDDEQRELVEAITRGVIASCSASRRCGSAIRPGRRGASATRLPLPTCSTSAEPARGGEFRDHDQGRHTG